VRVQKESVEDVIKQQFKMPEVGFFNQNKPECTADLSSPPLLARVTRLVAYDQAYATHAGSG